MVVDQNFHPDRQERAELFGSKQRHANATMAGRTSGNREAAVNRYAVDDVIRIVEQPERAKAPALDLPQHFESTGWCARTVKLTVVLVECSVTGGD